VCIASLQIVPKLHRSPTCRESLTEWAQGEIILRHGLRDWEITGNNGDTMCGSRTLFVHEFCGCFDVKGCPSIRHSVRSPHTGNHHHVLAPPIAQLIKCFFFLSGSSNHPMSAIPFVILLQPLLSFCAVTPNRSILSAASHREKLATPTTNIFP
jgi:hypothetical protein